MTVTKDHTGTVRLVDRRTRCVEVFGREPMGSRYATDRQLMFHEYRMGAARPQRIGFCFWAAERRAKFLVDKGPRGDALLDLLARHPKTPARPARPYGIKGWLVEG